MASITLTIPDDQVARVTAALCAAAGVDPSPANARKALIVARSLNPTRAVSAAELSTLATVARTWLDPGRLVTDISPESLALISPESLALIAHVLRSQQLSASAPDFVEVAQQLGRAIAEVDRALSAPDVGG